jgi:hypothetical protein
MHLFGVKISMALQDPSANKPIWSVLREHERSSLPEQTPFKHE